MQHMMHCKAPSECDVPLPWSLRALHIYDNMPGDACHRVQFQHRYDTHFGVPFDTFPHASGLSRHHVGTLPNEGSDA